MYPFSPLKPDGLKHFKDILSTEKSVLVEGENGLQKSRAQYFLWVRKGGL
jgi:hypothetical protein